MRILLVVVALLAAGCTHVGGGLTARHGGKDLGQGTNVFGHVEGRAAVSESTSLELAVMAGTIDKIYIEGTESTARVDACVRQGRKWALRACVGTWATEGRDYRKAGEFGSLGASMRTFKLELDVSGSVESGPNQELRLEAVVRRLFPRDRWTWSIVTGAAWHEFNYLDGREDAKSATAGVMWSFGR